MSFMIRRAAFALAMGLLVSTVAEAQWVWTPETGRFVNLKRLPKETAELQLEHARSLMLQGELDNALRETGKFIDFYGDSPVADENQFLRGEIRLAKGDYVKAAQEYQQVVLSYPESNLYNRVIEEQYTIGDTLFDQGMRRMERRESTSWYQRPFAFGRKRPFRRAIRVYNMVQANQPFTPEAAEAQYKIGLCHFMIKEYIEAEIEYQAVLERYPASPYVNDAHYGLVKTYEARALPPAYDQEPSRLAVDAARDYRRNYPGDPRTAEMDELEREMLENIAEHKYQIARFYERRQQFPSSRIYYNVVVEQYPGTAAAAKSQEWLDAHPTNPTSVGQFLTPSYR